jgi:hypothetical protein
MALVDLSVINTGDHLVSRLSPQHQATSCHGSTSLGASTPAVVMELPRALNLRTSLRIPSPGLDLLAHEPQAHAVPMRNFPGTLASIGKARFADHN